MNLPISAGGSMTTLDLRALINEARQAFGEPIVRNDKFLDRVRDELDGELGGCKKIPHPQSGVEMEFYDLNRDQCMLVAMRESKGVRRRVVAKLNAADRQALVIAVPQSLPEALRMAADLAEQNDSLKQLNHDQSIKIDSLTSQFMDGETPPAFAKRLNGVNVQQLNARLLELGWLYDSSTDPDEHHYRAASYARDRYLTESPLTLRKEGKKSRIRYSQVLLMAGAERLFDLYLKQKLPMKNTWDGRFSHVKFPRDTQ